MSESIFTTANGTKFVNHGKVTISGEWNAVNAFINAGCPEPIYKNGCPILGSWEYPIGMPTKGPQRDDL